MDGDLLLLPLDRQLHTVGCGWGGGRLCTARILRLQGGQTVAATAARQSNGIAPQLGSTQPWACSTTMAVQRTMVQRRTCGRCSAAVAAAAVVTRALRSAGSDQ